MKKILLILLVAISAITFTGCKFVCKMCPPPCGTPQPPSTSKTLNYYIYIADTLHNSPFVHYYANFNNNASPEVIVPGHAFNISYNPSTANDSITVKVYAEDADGGQVTMAYYKLPIYWNESNGGDTLFENQIFYNPSPSIVVTPPNPTPPIPICKNYCP